MIFGRRYRTIEKIGSGGMADVYKAVDEVLGRTVAVKVLHERYASEPDFVTRFRQEAQAAANLSHPNIVNIYDWGREGETYYIVMELVRGTDLKALIRERGPLDPRKAADYAAQVCSALAVAHGYDIIHRDIKPQNIVLTPDGTIKVMDFGIARAGGTTLTQTGSVLGTAHYVSPEQAQGKPLGPSSDLYSLGVVLYELTTGRLPFEADTPVAVALKQVNDIPVPPRQIDPEIPTALEAIILKSMSKDPSERYQSAEEMRADLRRVVAGEAAAAAVPVAPETSVLPAVESPRGPAVAGPPRRRRSAWPWVILALLLVTLVALFAAWRLGAFDNSVAVPDLTTGLTVPEARTQLTAVGLLLGSEEATFSDTVPSGQIVAQDPVAGTRVEPGSAIDVVVSRGEEKIAVPELVGSTEDQAISSLIGLGLTPRITREYSTKVAAFEVISTDPPGGTKVSRGTGVKVVISRGIETKKVPDVEGKKVAQARSQLEKQGFSVKLAEEFSETVAAGVVIGQDPPGGSVVEAGATVELRVSKGREQIPMPNVVGMIESDAIAELQSAGLTATVTFVDAEPDKAGYVVDQSPPPGTSLNRGAQVTVIVGRAPAEP